MLRTRAHAKFPPRALRWLAGSAVEISSSADVLDWTLERLPPATPVYIRSQSNGDSSEILRAACRLSRAGAKPVPHVAVRRFESAQALQRHLDSLVADAGVERVLLVAGHVEEAAGPMADCMAALEADVLPRCGLKAVELAGYPEGHPVLAAPLLDAALSRKIRWLRDHGVATTVVSQLSVSAEALVRWHAGLLGQAGPVQVRIGLAAPVTLGEHVHYAAMCASESVVDELLEQASASSLLSLLHPEPLMRQIAASLTESAVIDGFLLFGLGSDLAYSLAWRCEQIRHARGMARMTCDV